MKKFLLFPLFLLVLGVGVFVGQNRPRFEHVYTQFMDETNAYFEVYHDLDTGGEIVCVGPTRNIAGQSCFLSGRNWKGTK